jgi:CRP-like cAMP-binding protein
MQHLPAPTKDITPGIAAGVIRRRNLVLAALPSARRRQLIARCELVELSFGAVLCEPGDRIHHVYFPLDSSISLISSIDGRSRSVGLVGAEGMLGISLMLGVNVAPLRALVQGAGSALRLDAAQFSRQLKQSPALERALKRYTYVVMSHFARMAVCSRFHLIEARLARWLLMTRDRANSGKFHLTQEVAAYMLGVRRGGITGAANALQKRKLIRYHRGTVTILDGRRLEAASCPCYATAAQMYARLMR